MVKKNKANLIDRLIIGMSIAFFLFLVWAILWKCGVPYIGDGTLRTVNLLPFRNNAWWELQFNIAIFLPCGFYLSAVKSEWSLLKRVTATLFISFTLEVIQFVLAIGYSDVTDLLMNTLGGIMGIAVFFVVSRLSGKKGRKVIFVICLLLTLLELYMALSFIFFGRLNIGFMMIKL
ncbi:VanZ family protein [Clostridia bacterium]|nr:VanZ family protein [Clostridia bacterium]